MKTQKVIIFCIIFIIGVICGWMIQLAILTDPREKLATITEKLDHKAVIARVVDGDTIWLEDSRLVRIMGIDTPELKKKVGGKWIDVENPDPAAIESREWLSQFQGHTVTLSYEKARADRFRRTLAHVYILPDGPDIACEILRRGWSKVSAIPPNTKRYQMWKDAAK